MAILIPRILRPILDLPDFLDTDRIAEYFNPEDGLIEKVFAFFGVSNSKTF